MNAKIELKGQQFGALTVIAHCPWSDRRKRTHWICECHCGRRLLVRSDNLRKGKSRQCSECRGNVGRSSVFIEEGEIHEDKV